jgi:ribulose-phosphate 3-epimerase
MKNYVSASVLSADLLDMRNEIKKLETNGVDMLHFDVMDGIFVNNITYGLPVLEQVRRVTDMTLDVHLMITDPLRYAERFAKAGADIISFHSESESDTLETIRTIKACGVRAAVAIKPATPAESVYEFLPEIDMLLVMTVEPGFGGQSFMADMMPKVEAIKAEINRRGLNVLIEADGGIGDATIAEVARAGVDVSVAGTAVFKAENPSQAIKRLAAY